MKHLLMAAAAAALLLAACGDDDEPLKSKADLQVEDSLAVGEAADVGDLRVKVLGLDHPPTTDTHPEPPNTRWLVIEIRVENPGSKEAKAPSVKLSCEGKSVGNRYFHEPQTEYTFQPLAPKSFEEGTVKFGIPDRCTTGIFTVRAGGEEERWLVSS